ncbi:glycosyltransferase [Nonomuraea sp. NEAU-A123]|uniref:glycosyltransferase n=1 Tax=Nonomuraea sp. NEAU-A123 TaxID=2839649 RepID=UPI001BE45541|nr:glycosyltransferase [Nonomuraea sp. NEAU-A123]MBT2231634.1 glycosyltransferase [Nonomuraea sp. NEAU-A123]
MRVLLSTYGSRGDVEPLVGLAVRLRELGAEVRMCAPPDKDAGTPPVYVGFGSMRRVSEDVARVAIEVIRAQGHRVLVGCGWADLGLIDDRDGPTPTTESLSAALKTALTPETRARATAVAATNRTDGATVAAKLLLDAFSRESRPVAV